MTTTPDEDVNVYPITFLRDPPKVRYYWAEEATVEAEEWLTEGWIPAKSFVFIYGRHGSAKSFLALEWALRSSFGMDWFGNKTPEAFGTLFCVGEKKSRFEKRLVAWLKENGRENQKPGVCIRDGCPNILDAVDLDDFIAEVNGMKREFDRRGAPLKAIVLDTWARSLGGVDPSDAGAANQANEAVQRIIDETGCTVSPIAHVAKTQGSDSIKGAGEYGDAADAYIFIERTPGQRLRTVTLGKQSDGEDGLKFCFEPDLVEVGTDARGRPITSIVLRQVDLEPGQNRMSPKVEPRLKNIIRCLNMCMDAGQIENVPALSGVPPGTKGVLRTVLRDRLIEEGCFDTDTTPHAQRKNYWRDLEKLTGLSLIRTSKTMVWFLPK